MADADLPRCLTFPPAISSRSPMTGPSAYAVDRFQPAARSGEWTRRHPPPGTGPDFPNPATASIRDRARFVPATPGPRSSAPCASDTDRRGSSSRPTIECTTSCASCRHATCGCSTSAPRRTSTSSRSTTRSAPDNIRMSGPPAIDSSTRPALVDRYRCHRLSVTHDARVIAELRVLRRRGVRSRVVAPRRADRRFDRSCSAPGLHHQLGYRQRLVDAPVAPQAAQPRGLCGCDSGRSPRSSATTNVPAFTVLVAAIVGEPRR